jgi:hypothetical protein
MKEPPQLAATRNSTTQFSAQNQQQAAVMMVYGLDTTTSNTDKLFNLVCLYGKLESVGNADFTEKAQKFVGKAEFNLKLFPCRKCGSN